MTIQIRLVQMKDAKFVQEYATDIRISETSNVPYPYPEDGAESWARMVINRREQGISIVFSVFQEEQFAGVMSINAINNENKTAELDYWIAVPFWHKGIATEAARLAIEYAFNELNLETLRSACLAKNKGSSKVLEKNGFIKTNEFVFQDGKFKDHIGYRYQLKNSRIV